MATDNKSFLNIYYWIDSVAMNHVVLFIDRKGGKIYSHLFCLQGNLCCMMSYKIALPSPHITEARNAGHSTKSELT